MHRINEPGLRRLANSQSGILTREQLAIVGVDRWSIAHRVKAGRWQRPAPGVIVVNSGELMVDQRRWVAVLHGGDDALLAGVAAAQSAGLQKWSRPEIEVLVPHSARMPSPLEGAVYRRTRRDLRTMRERRAVMPRCRIEVAVLLFAASEPNPRTAAGIIAAAIQQRLTTPDSLLEWLDRLTPLRWSAFIKEALNDFAGGMQSVGERDVKRMCQRYHLAPPRRQTPRRDATGRWRFTDCEWPLNDRRILVLEVDGAFHMDVDQWEEDLKRQRALASDNRVTVHCTTRELRDCPENVARDLIRVGVSRTLGDRK